MRESYSSSQASDLPFVQSIADAVGLDLYGITSPGLPLDFSRISTKGVAPPEQLPKIAGEYRVILLPYSLDDFSLSITPAKYFEALSTGALLVTRAPLFHLPGFREFCYAATDLDPAELREALQIKLCEHQRRWRSQIEFSRRHTWNARINDLKSFLGF